MDYSSVTFPVSVVEETDTWKPRNGFLGEEDERFWAYYGMKGQEKYKDAPVSLQLVGRRYREEEVLAILERVWGDLEKARNR